ncbi:hypothetical protein C2G38_2230702 [Gigaspora rosea]|uniref:BTB/POZ domain-containing protein n=1 Tax=Gigaspora rosea TaxID=44941 RepID=A0A397TTW5_9GLOM|nr:hypothetical protein C2G38_2230702 [Gigaspora rosea]
MTSSFITSLIRDLNQLLEHSENYDVKIQAGENQNSKEFKAHSNILCARCPYFKSALSTNWVTRKDGYIVFSKPNISPSVFELILRFMYTGVVSLEKQSGRDMLSLMVAADELLLEELVIYVQDYLVTDQCSWVQQNFVQVLHTVFRLSNCKKLQDFCLESICEDPQPFFISSDFNELDKEILFGLVKREDLRIDETEMWDYLIQWGIARTPGLGPNNNDISNWNSVCFAALKETLDQFMPYIRFTEISRADFYDKVRPYKQILGHELYEEMMQFHFKDKRPKNADLPARIAYSRIDSVILKPKHAAVISNWIERKESPFVFSKKNAYQFNLIYRGTRDGFSNVAIINRCQNHGSYVVVIKIRGSNKVVGGYNSLGYRRSMNNTQSFQSGFLTQMEWKYSLDSFLFNSDDMKNIKTMHLSRVSTPNQAHYASTHHAVNFGNSDLICNGLAGSCYKNYYQYRLLESEFTTEEIEIFAVNPQ